MDRYCLQMKICVEADGSSPDNVRARADDALRDDERYEMGITTWRHIDAEVEANPTAAADGLARRLARRKGSEFLRGWTSRRLVPVAHLPPSLSYLAGRS